MKIKTKNTKYKIRRTKSVKTSLTSVNDKNPIKIMLDSDNIINEKQIFVAKDALIVLLSLVVNKIIKPAENIDVKDKI
jgi:hypothetical protein